VGEAVRPPQQDLAQLDRVKVDVAAHREDVAAAVFDLVVRVRVEHDDGRSPLGRVVPDRDREAGLDVLGVLARPTRGGPHERGQRARGVRPDDEQQV
jgi:hypothetical protein